jgi:hypothetical protein
MGIWVYPYTVRPVQVGGGFWGFGGVEGDLGVEDLSLNYVVMLGLRLQ